MLTELERSILFNVFECINRILITRISQLLVINNALKTKVDFRQSIIMLFHTPKTSMLQSRDAVVRMLVYRYINKKICLVIAGSFANKALAISSLEAFL